MTAPHIIGWSHTPFGKHDQLGLEQLIRNAVGPALASADVEPADVDGIFVGTFNGGFVPQDFSGALVAVAMPEFRHTPAVRLENACATGSAAIWAALDALESGRMRHALVLGFEKMNTLPGPQIGEVLLKCSYVAEEGSTPGGFAGVFGQIAGQYFERYGDQSDALAAIAAKNHRNGVDNPYAHLRRDLGFDFCRNGLASQILRCPTGIVVEPKHGLWNPSQNSHPAGEGFRTDFPRCIQAAEDKTILRQTSLGARTKSNNFADPIITNIQSVRKISDALPPIHFFFR